MKLLFQGDSITDGNRLKDPAKRWDLNHQIGHSYAYIIAGRLGFEYPKMFEFVNRGISGNTVWDLEKRWDTDAIEEHPDLLSILVGINDSRRAVPDGITHTEHYESGYRRILDRSFAANDRLKLIILEPFTLRYAAYQSESDDEYAARRERLGEMSEAARRIARDYGGTFIELQKHFDRLAAETDSSEYWLWDGIHATESGNHLIAEEWLKAAKPLLNI